MDSAVCLECGDPTESLSARIDLPSGAVTRTWRECRRCGWESAYEDAVSH